MFWKTCLTHTGEILLALGIAWLLGYLWNRWFGQKNDSVDKKEYEEQIRSLRDRIKIQDDEVRLAKANQDQWAAERAGYQHSLSSLQNEMNALSNNFQEYIPPAELRTIQTRYEESLKAAEDKSNALAAERKGLLSSLSSLENQLQLALKQADEGQARWKQAQTDLSQAVSATDRLEDEINQLASRLNQQATDKKIQEDTIQTLRVELDTRDKQIQELSAALSDAKQKTSETTNQYQELIANKDLELGQLAQQLAAAAGVPSRPEETEQLRQEINDLQTELAGIRNEEQNTGRRLQEYQLQIHQLEQELISQKSENNKLAQQSQKTADLEKALLESNRKAGEWEARWKEAAMDAEHISAAHASLLKEKENQVSRIAELESELEQLRTTARDRQDEEAEWTNRQKDFLEKLQRGQDIEKAYESTNAELNLARQALAQKEQLLAEWKTSREENDARKEEFQQQLKASQLQLEANEETIQQQQQLMKELQQKLEQSQQELIQSRRQYHDQASQTGDWEQRLNLTQQALDDARNQLAENKTNQSVLETLISEWEKKYHSIQKELHQTEQQLSSSLQTSNNQASSLNTWETRFKELQDALEATQLQHAQSLKHQNTLEAIIAEWERKYYDARVDLQHTQDQLNEHIRARETEAASIGEWEEKFLRLQSELAVAQNKLNETLAERDRGGETLREAEKRFKELSDKFNIVQLQFADSQRQNSHLEEDLLKAKEYQLKYNQESRAWQKRLHDLEKEYADRVTELQARLDKEIKAISHERDLLNVQLATPNPAPTTVPAPTPVHKRRGRTKEVMIEPVPVDWKAVSLIMGKKIKPDDLKIIEGIGPKISNLLRRNQVKSWSALSETKAEDIQGILEKGGTQFTLADPRTWPDQAKLAAAGDWQKLKKLQEKLYAGRKKRPKTKSFPALTPADLEAAADIFGRKIKQDDLKIIEGIGPKIAALLRKSGIKTWQALSATRVKSIRLILEQAGNKFNLADPTNWPAQAKLAARGRWKRLKALQDQLNS